MMTCVYIHRKAFFSGNVQSGKWGRWMPVYLGGVTRMVCEIDLSWVLFLRATGCCSHGGVSLFNV
ncbi:hypothetical protein OIU84_000797 [Salix udensis]|uniref:Uncharacterized protein n=1 Tax=Salix udensis TaxID=889485 RepID=A0AAD6L5K7_9ROSI|nr:hypothetical protein OIU84_000797 [Salix udensis]